MPTVERGGAIGRKAGLIALSKGTGDSMSMAEKRSEHSDESYQPASKEAGDPLAELARLIGQNDPFNDVGRPVARKPLDSPQADNRSAPEWLARPAAADDYDQHDQHPAPRDPYRGDPRYQQPDDGQHDAVAHDERQDDRHDERNVQASPVAAAQEPHYDDRYRVAPPPAGDYDGDHYYADDGHMPPHGEERPPSRRRGGLLTIAAILGLAVIGTAGAFGYRAFTSSPGGSANPPVIKADPTPSKVVPAAQPTADAQGKPFQERVGSATLERVVPREEQPVSLPVPPQPRPNAPQTAFAPTSTASLAAPPSPPGAFAEPKRVKTQTIRPDAINDAAAPTQSSGGAASRAPMAIAPPQAQPEPRTRTAARTPAPAAGAYAVQVSAQKSEAEAQSSYRALQQKYPTVLGGREASIRRVDLGDKGGIFFRAQVGSFATMEQANTFCSNLKEAGGQCIVQRN